MVSRENAAAPSTPFVDPDPFQELAYPNVIAAKRAISAFLRLPLARLPPEELAKIDAILAEAGTDKSRTLRINAFVTDRAHMPGYMAARDAWLANVDQLPASTLVIVSGFTRPEFLVEVEVTAALP